MAYNLATAYVPIVPSMDGVGKAIEKAFGDASKTTGSKTGQSIGKGLSVGFASKVGAVAGITSNVFSKVASVVTSSLGSAVDRADQMNNFPKVMKNLGYSATDAAASIKKISDALDGLPTTSSAMTGMVQQLAPLTSNLDEATDIALAFNNAMLAGGASTMEQENALTQYTQMLSAGKVDMQAWRSIQAAMPGQLNQVAEAMMGAGHNANDLYEAMKSGKFSFDDFNKAVMDLNQNGFGKYASFAQQAKDATQGIGTAMENVKNRVAKAVQKVIDAVGVENIAGAINRFSSQFGKVGDAAAGMVTDVKKKFSEAGKWITGLYDKLDKTGAITRFKDTISTAFESARSRVTEAVDRIAGSFKGLVPDGAIVSAIEDVLKYVGTVFSDFADWVADTVEWWSKFIAALKDTGAVQQLAGALGSLFDAIGDVADAFRGAGDMAESAAGRFDSAKGSAELLGAVIKVAADLVQKMADQLKRVAEWVKKFTDTLSDSGALDTWMDALERIFSALGDALGSLKRLGKALDGGKKSAEGAGDGLDTAAAAAKGFAAYIGAVANVVETVAGVLDGIASAQREVPHPRPGDRLPARPDGLAGRHGRQPVQLLLRRRRSHRRQRLHGHVRGTGEGQARRNRTMVPIIAAEGHGRGEPVPDQHRPMVPAVAADHRLLARLRHHAPHRVRPTTGFQGDGSRTELRDEPIELDTAAAVTNLDMADSNHPERAGMGKPDDGAGRRRGKPVPDRAWPMAPVAARTNLAMADRRDKQRAGMGRTDGGGRTQRRQPVPARYHRHIAEPARTHTKPVLQRGLVAPLIRPQHHGRSRPRHQERHQRRR